MLIIDFKKSLLSVKNKYMKLQNIDFLLPWVFKRELAAPLGFYYGYNI